MLRDPSMCRSIDGQMDRAGEGWVCDDELPDMNARMTAAAIAKKFGFQRWDIANWCRAGGFDSMDGPTGAPVYRVGDVLAYFAQKNSKPNAV